MNTTVYFLLYPSSILPFLERTSKSFRLTNSRGRMLCVIRGVGTYLWKIKVLTTRPLWYQAPIS